MGSLRKLLWLVGLVVLCGAAPQDCINDPERVAADADGSAGALVPEVNACDTVVARTCGVDDGGGPCATTPECTASTLTRQYTPDACVALRDDEANYPACANRAVQTCGDLLVKACGSADGGVCTGWVSCQAAQDVANAGNAPLCRQALGDETSYPRCTP